MKKYSYYENKNIVLHEQRSIYFFIPKVACSSLKRVCADLLGIEVSDNCFSLDEEVHKIDFPSINSNRLNKSYEDYFKFCFVRNPWDRMVSCYNNKILPYKNKVNYNFRSFPQFEVGMSFEDFIYAIYEIPDEKADSHFKSQISFIEDRKGKSLIDYIGRFENFENDLKEIFRIMGVSNMNVPWLMKSNRLNKDYSIYYNRNTQKLIEERYARDIEGFRYSFHSNETP